MSQRRRVLYAHAGRHIARGRLEGVGGAQQIAMAPGTMSASMMRMAKKSRAYFARGEKHVFEEADREVAQESKVKGNR